MDREVIALEPRTRRRGVRFTSRGFRWPLPRGCRLETLRFPGRWMTDEQLEGLRRTIYEIASYRLDVLPEYGVFLPGREPYKNRIVTLAYDGDRPVAFGAMVWIPVRLDRRVEPVLHLGLVVTTPNRLAPQLLFHMYYYPVFYVVLQRCPDPFWVSSLTMEPSIIGRVSDYFPEVLPHYRGGVRPDPLRRAIARGLMTQHGHEYGLGPEAELDEETFVVKASCRGPSESLRYSYRGAAKYTVRECNHYCRDLLDYDRGDELLQLGRAHTFHGIRLGLRWRFNGRAPR